MFSLVDLFQQLDEFTVVLGADVLWCQAGLEHAEGDRSNAGEKQGLSSVVGDNPHRLGGVREARQVGIDRLLAGRIVGLDGDDAAAVGHAAGRRWTLHE